MKVDRQTARHGCDNGFTLIELVVVIVMMGILAATALPKFVDIGKDARGAAVESLRGTIRSAAQTAYLKCSTSPPCDLNSRGAWAGGNASTSTIVIDGTTFYLHYGYPINWTDAGDAANIVGLLNISGFTVKPYVGGSYIRDFTLNGAPDPDNCKATYSFPSGYNEISVTVTTTGC